MAARAEAPLAEYTREEVARHNTASDFWTIIRRKVYRFDEEFVLYDHPGGYVMLSGAGKDGTQLFFQDHWHSDTAQAMLESFCIGRLKDLENEGNIEDTEPGATK